MSEIINIQQQFGDYLFNFIKSRVSCIEDAQDIYQEVILKIIHKSSQLTKSQGLKSWLFTIAKNQIIDFYRTKKVSVDVDALSNTHFVQKEENSTYQELEGCIHGFIDALPDDYKEIIFLSEIEGRSQKELSQLLEINYVTLRSKVQRGRDKIRKMIFDACIVEQDRAGRFVGCIPKPDSSSCSTLDPGGCANP